MNQCMMWQACELPSTLLFFLPLRRDAGYREIAKDIHGRGCEVSTRGFNEHGTAWQTHSRTKHQSRCLSSSFPCPVFPTTTPGLLSLRLLLQLPLPHQRARRHGKLHVVGSINQLQNRRGGLAGVVLALARLVLGVAIQGLGAEHACVAAGAVGVARAQGAEEFGEEFVGALWLCRDTYDWLGG